MYLVVYMMFCYVHVCVAMCNGLVPYPNYVLFKYEKLDCLYAISFFRLKIQEIENDTSFEILFDPDLFFRKQRMFIMKCVSKFSNYKNAPKYSICV